MKKTIFIIAIFVQCIFFTSCSDSTGTNEQFLTEDSSGNLDEDTNNAKIELQVTTEATKAIKIGFDKNNNYIIDPEEYSVTTNPDGIALIPFTKYELLKSYRILAYCNLETVSESTKPIILSAPAGFKFISIYTTLIDEQCKKGFETDYAIEQILSISRNFSDNSIDLLSLHNESIIDNELYNQRIESISEILTEQLSNLPNQRDHIIELFSLLSESFSNKNLNESRHYRPKIDFNNNEFVITPNYRPVANQNIPMKIVFKNDFIGQHHLHYYFSDIDQDNITFEAEGMPKGIFLNEGIVLTGEAFEIGTFLIKIYANDSISKSEPVLFYLIVEKQKEETAENKTIFAFGEWPLVNASVFADRNENLTPEPSELIGITDTNGGLEISYDDYCQNLILVGKKDVTSYAEKNYTFRNDFILFAPRKSLFINPLTSIAHNNNLSLRQLSEKLGIPHPSINRHYSNEYYHFDYTEGDLITHFDTLVLRKISDYYIFAQCENKSFKLKDVLKLLNTARADNKNGAFNFVATYIIEDNEGNYVLKLNNEYSRIFCQNTLRIFSLNSGKYINNNGINKLSNIQNNRYALSFEYREELHPEGYYTCNYGGFYDASFPDTPIYIGHIEITQRHQKFELDLPIMGINSFDILYIETSNEGNLIDYVQAIAKTDNGELFWLEGSYNITDGEHGPSLILDTSDIMLSEDSPNNYKVVYDDNFSPNQIEISTFDISVQPSVYKGYSKEYGHSIHQIHANSFRPNYIRYRDKYCDIYEEDLLGGFIKCKGWTTTCGDLGGFGVVGGNVHTKLLLIADISNSSVYTGVYAPAGCKGPNGIVFNHFGITSKNLELLDMIKLKLQRAIDE